MWFNPWVGKIPKRRAWQPPPVLSGESPRTKKPGGLWSIGLRSNLVAAAAAARLITRILAAAFIPRIQEDHVWRLQATLHPEAKLSVYICKSIPETCILQRWCVHVKVIDFCWYMAFPGMQVKNAFLPYLILCSQRPKTSFIFVYFLWALIQSICSTFHFVSLALIR